MAVTSAQVSAALSKASELLKNKNFTTNTNVINAINKAQTIASKITSNSKSSSSSSSKKSSSSGSTSSTSSSSSTSNPTTMQGVLSQIQLGSYTPRTDAERQALAEALYKAQLETDLTNAANTYNTTEQQVNAQKATTNTNYDNQYAKQQLANETSVASADRASLARGMQRSSYNAANVANLRATGDQTLNEIEQNRTNAIADLEAQLATAATNKSNSENTARSNYESNVLAKVQELESEDWERQNTVNTSNNSTLIDWATLLKNSSSSSSGSYSNNKGDTNPTGDNDSSGNALTRAFDNIANNYSNASTKNTLELDGTYTGSRVSKTNALNASIGKNTGAILQNAVGVTSNSEKLAAAKKALANASK